MKKYFIVFAMLIFVLAGCSQDEVSKKVIADIDALGEIDLEDESQIAKIEEIYNNMTDKQKNQVDNYSVLLEAKDTVEQLKEELAKTGEYKYSILCAQSIKNSLKRADSFKLLTVGCVYIEENGRTGVMVNIDYSAENSLGNTISNSELIIFSDGEVALTYDLGEDESKYNEAYNNLFRKYVGDIQTLDADLIMKYIK